MVLIPPSSLSVGLAHSTRDQFYQEETRLRMKQVGKNAGTMNKVIIKNWSAWAQGLENQKDWLSLNWDTFDFDRLIQQEGSREKGPKTSFIPMMQRRRCTPLNKMSLQVSQECCSKKELEEVIFVFASFHGELHLSFDLLDQFFQGEEMSANRFIHSTHTTTAGHFSIANKNQMPSIAISGGVNAFCYGFLEAMGFLKRFPQKKLLLVVADEPTPSFFNDFQYPPPFSYSLGLLLSSEGEGQEVQFNFEPGATSPGKEKRIPQAFSFLRWFLSTEETPLILQADDQQWKWEKSSISS